VLLKSCPRCGNLIPYGKTHCAACEPIVAAEREKRRAESARQSNRRYNKKRDPKYSQFYNSKDWRTLSARYIQDRGFRCEECGSIASAAHHIIPIQTPEGWERRMDYTNLCALCDVCHNKKPGHFLGKKKKSKNR
jgi:5-methylcytosine-specific restriction endonuclease McrA